MNGMRTNQPYRLCFNSAETLASDTSRSRFNDMRCRTKLGTAPSVYSFVLPLWLNIILTSSDHRQTIIRRVWKRGPAGVIFEDPQGVGTSSCLRYFEDHFISAMFLVLISEFTADEIALSLARRICIEWTMWIRSREVSWCTQRGVIDIIKACLIRRHSELHLTILGRKTHDRG